MFRPMFPLTSHAEIRMRERSISTEEITRAIEYGIAFPTHSKHRVVLYNPNDHIYVVLDTNQHKIITVFDSDYRKMYTFRRNKLSPCLRTHHPPSVYHQTPVRYEILS